MAYWWVNQRQTWKHEYSGGYLWAPYKDSAGRSPFHWQTMAEVRAGDVIFSYVGQAIVAVSTAAGPAYDTPQPREFEKGDTWEQQGRRVDVSYQLVEPLLQLSKIVAEFSQLLPTRYSPLTQDGTGNQGYLFPLPPAAGRYLPDRLNVGEQGGGEDLLARAIERTTPDKTVRQALLESRIGQGRFRNDLLAMWQGQCAVTGLALTAILRASHIRPWRDSDNQQRLDPYNGLLLAPSYDALFDRGLISFGADGELIISVQLSAADLTILGISRAARLRAVRPEHLPYFEYHRRNVFAGQAARKSAQ